MAMPRPRAKKDDKCPAPGHTDSFIECILDLQTSITLLASCIKATAVIPTFEHEKRARRFSAEWLNIQ